jgi:hypothetical protein
MLDANKNGGVVCSWECSGIRVRKERPKMIALHYMPSTFLIYHNQQNIKEFKLHHKFCGWDHRKRSNTLNHHIPVRGRGVSKDGGSAGGQ